MSTPICEEETEKFARHLKLLIFLFLIVPMVLLAGFVEFRFRSLQSSIPHLVPGLRDEARMEIDVMPWHPVEGQRLYVPAYSHVYHEKGEPYFLTVTLNIRNTDIDNEIVVTSVRYFDTSGNELRSMLKKTIKLGPLAATEFVVDRDDKSGGSGASFIVEWQAGTKVNQPLVETVMIDTQGQQGVSFIAPSVVLSERAE
ncbi:hypothetical protein Q31b_51540 [Novipirellula aureliae]|uniref:DUF3124 domain-containing protein n=1 Tax=Novipirellula aureliae TaxID=2527966 RepID=A0A5C6DLD1_9BACT|nr:DUF3124 domain-containing protein [Novipirellula aureliae]TWU35719.1 hypothetical protein Q31b_51540 [Novipirellula aureliae]